MQIVTAGPEREYSIEVPGLDQLAVVRDSFTDTTGTILQAHASDNRVGWRRHPNYATSGLTITDAGRVRTSTALTTLFYALRQPDTADYDVEADWVPITLQALSQMGIAGRIDPAAQTYYFLRYRPSILAFELMRALVGANVTLKTIPDALPLTRRMTLRFRGSIISVLRDGAEVATVENAEITDRGHAGIFAGGALNTNSTGVHLDNFRVLPAPSGLNGSEPLVTVPSFYVDAQRGNDANPGTDGEPWLTWERAFDETPDAALIAYVSGRWAGETLATGKRDRSAPVTFMPHPGREFVFEPTPARISSCDMWRVVGFDMPGKQWVLRGSSNASMGCKRFQVIGCRSKQIIARKSQYSAISLCDVTGATAAGKGISYEANLNQIPGWQGNHYAYVQDTESHNHFGDGFGSFEVSHEFILRRVRIADCFVFGGDHADGYQIEAPMGLEISDGLVENVNGSGGAVFITGTLLLDNSAKCHIIIRNLGLFDTNTNGIVVGQGARIFLEHITAYGTNTFGDLKIGNARECVFVNCLIGKLWIDTSGGAPEFAYRENNVIDEGLFGTAIDPAETQGTPTFVADGKRLAASSALGVGAGDLAYGPFEMPDRDVDNFERAPAADLGFSVAV